MEGGGCTNLGRGVISQTIILPNYSRRIRSNKIKSNREMSCLYRASLNHQNQKNIYRSGTVNSKSFIGKVLLRIKWKFELN